MAARRGRPTRNTRSTPETNLKEEASPSPATLSPRRGAGNSDSGSASAIIQKIEKQSPQPKAKESPQPKAKPSPMKTEVKPDMTETPQEPMLDPELEPDHESLQAALQEALESEDTSEVNMTESMVSSFVEAARMAAEKAKNESSFKTGSKRKAEDGEEPELMDVETDSDGNKNGKPRAKRKRKSLGPVTPKNALMQLNELKPGLTFDVVSQTGPNHSPIFTVKVTVNDNEFEGSGTSKKRAKTQAAERALSSFVQFRNASEAHVAMGRNVVNGDFTMDSDDLSDAIMTDFSPSVQGAGAGAGAPPSNGGAMTSPPVSKAPAEQPKNPVMLLNEVKPGMKYEFEGESGENQNKNFVMSVTIDDRKFEGVGRSKKLAKSKAAQEALLEFFGIDCSQGAAMKNGMGQVLPSSDAPRLPQTLADHIMKLVFTKFTELTNADGTNYARRKVLAGFVVTQGMEPEDARVVCLATGTKCINGEYISDQGLALNDCHAEIIARRSFKRYLFGQLALLLGSEEEKSSSIFTPNSTGGYKLKDDVQVHLYISTSPCGDARIFSPHETPSDASQDKHPNRKARGQLRTKIESGEGTIPVKSSPSIQTWDGVLQGERLLTMSCSDKVCKWNTLGLQGSLLSHFVEPIYLNSVILGSLYHGDHMSRAMFGRVSNIKELPSPYRVNRPYLSCISNPERRQPGKAPGFSVNWALGDSHLEVINCTTGKDEQGSPSQVCKQALFSMFQQLYGRLSSITPPAPDANMGVYCDMKQLVTDYQTAKAQLYQCFLESGFGIWVGKPMEQDVFSLSH